MKKKILVTRSSMPEYEEYIKEIKALWDTHWLTNMGCYHQRLEQQLKEYLEVDYISLFTNGHLALELVLQAMNLTGEVITTPFTFASTTHAIVRNNLTPVFCDINSQDFTMDCSKLEQLITERTSAIVPVHVYGNICDIEKIDAISKKYNLKVIYDAAHAFGVRYKNVNVGQFGDASMFSFHATKVFNTIEGGSICYHDQELGEKLYKLKNFGIYNEEVLGIGTNAKMNEFQAAMGICNLRHIGEEITKRENVVRQYMENLKDIPGLRLPVTQKDTESNFAYFPIIAQKEILGIGRDDIFSYLADHNIYARKYFYPLTNNFRCYSGRFNTENIPVAMKISEEVLTLPLYADLKVEDVNFICDKIIECIHERR